MNIKHRISLLIISFSLLLVLIPIQSGQGVVLPFKETFDTESTLNSWDWDSGSWFIDPIDPIEGDGGILSGKGTTFGWDDIWYINPFNESDYTISFRVFLESDYGAEQFHFVLDYETDSFRVELGSEEWTSHYITVFTPSSYIDLPVKIVPTVWTQVHLTGSSEGVKLWINGNHIDPGVYTQAPLLQKIAFGVYNGSYARFDNLIIEQGSHPPESEPINNWGVSIGETFSYTFSKYQGSSVELDVGRWFSSPEMSAVTPLMIEQGDELTLEVVSLTEKGVEVKVFLNSIHIRTSYTLFFFLPLNNMDDFFFDFFNGTINDEGEHLSGIFFGGNATTGVVEGEMLFYWSKSNGVLESIELISGPFPIPENEEVIDELLFELTSESTSTWAVSIDDEFTYRLSSFSGESSTIDLGSWFGSPEMSEYSSLLLQQGDELKIKVFTLTEDRIEVEVFLNNINDRTSYTNFFFLPVNKMDPNMDFGDMELIDEGEFYVGKMYSTNNGTGADEGEIELSWSKTTGALEKAEVLSGPFPDPDGEMIYTFLFELISASVQKSDTNPTINLSPGWELVICLGVLILLPLKKRSFRK